MTIVYAFSTGFACGVVFALMRLPIPAPPGLAGVAGVLGITLAFMLIHKVRP